MSHVHSFSAAGRGTTSGAPSEWSNDDIGLSNG